MKKTLCAFVLILAAAEALDAQLVTQRAGTSQILIAAAGSVMGVNGTFFRSDITIANYRTDADQLVRLTWLPEGESGSSVPPVDITVAKATGVTSEDFVTSVLHQSGLGSIWISALTSNGQIDPAGKIHATARIWSNQPGLSSGTVSQTFPIIALGDINSTSLTILGQRRDERFRTNLGIVNLDLAPQTFRIAAQSEIRTEIMSVSVPALSMRQVPLIGPPVAILQIVVSNISAGFQTRNFVVYGSSVDNITGDSWSSLGFIQP